MTTTLRSSLLLSGGLLLTACGPLPGQEFAAGLPTEETVRMAAPEGGTARQGLGAGATSDHYRLTRGVAVSVNGGTAAVLRLVRDITRHRPTTLGEDAAVWGPHTPALSPVTWRLSVKRQADGTYAYALAGREKAATAEGAFVTVLSGTHAPARDAAGEPLEGFGSGSFTVDWEARRALPEAKADEMGQGLFTYARPDGAGPVTVGVDFRQVRDAESGVRVDARYAFRAEPGAGGRLDFLVLKDQVAGARLERLAVRSRWAESGVGRSDVRLSGGDLPGEATVNECWDAAFLSRYARVSWAPADPQLNYGQASDCSPQGAEYSTE
jgi:hypothetical protein